MKYYGINNEVEIIRVRECIEYVASVFVHSGGGYRSAFLLRCDLAIAFYIVIIRKIL